MVEMIEENATPREKVKAANMIIGMLEDGYAVPALCIPYWMDGYIPENIHTKTINGIRCYIMD